jgi:solute carrier family 25 phosphate transporter 3
MASTTLATAGGAAPGFHTPLYYGQCMVGGVLACGLTHAAVVTLDVAKCRTQAHSKSGAWPNGLIASIGKSWELEGVAGITKGIVPTLFGYGAQGLFKFGFNEFFKDLYTTIVGVDTVNNSLVARLSLWGAASGSAEVFADLALCPFEMAKVKMQVALPGTAEAAALPTGMIGVMKAMSADKANTRFPFGSLYPLWGRQVPYTMIKFVGFYQTQDAVYAHLLKSKGRAKETYSEGEQLAITFGCGYFAGVFCAIATQPMDNLVSMKGNVANKDKSWGTMASEMGTLNLFTKGLVTRIIMIGTLTGLQWYVYGNWKAYCGFGTS